MFRVLHFSFRFRTNASLSDLPPRLSRLAEGLSTELYQDSQDLVHRYDELFGFGETSQSEVLALEYIGGLRFAPRTPPARNILRKRQS